MNTRGGKMAFTLIELLVVIAIIAILAAMLLPALSKAKAQSQGIYCMNNLKEMQIAIVSYTGDNHDYFPENTGGTTSSNSWCTGKLTWDLAPNPANPDNTNINYLMFGEIGPYVAHNVGIFKCPADINPGQRGPRVRSISMNGYVGDVLDINATADSGFLRYLKMADCTKPGPSMLFVILDECPDSINDEFFNVRMEPGSGWTDVPASTHNGAGGFSYADGHAEIKKWRDPNTLAPVKKVNPCPDNGLLSPNDEVWMQQRSSAAQ